MLLARIAPSDGRRLVYTVRSLQGFRSSAWTTAPPEGLCPPGKRAREGAVALRGISPDVPQFQERRADIPVDFEPFDRHTGPEAPQPSSLGGFQEILEAGERMRTGLRG